LVELVENLSGGNVRAGLGFLNTFVGSGHVDTKKILDAAAAGSEPVTEHIERELDFVYSSISFPHEMAAGAISLGILDGQLCQDCTLVSHHLRALRTIGLVSSRREGKMVMYALTDKGRMLLEAVLAPSRQAAV
jgi:hypothetical protein